MSAKQKDQANVMPAVSIIVPTYNQARYIPFTVRSVLAQTVADFELVIVNDGSTDGTGDYLDTLDDPRIRVIHQENRGGAAAINRGLSVASGDFVSWVSSDDVCAPYFLEAFLKAFSRNPDLDYIYSAYYTIDAAGAVTGIVDDNRPSYRGLVFNRNPGCISFLYRRALHDRVGFYDESIRMSYDTEMWARFFRDYGIGRVVEPLHYYRYHDAQATGVAVREGIHAAEAMRMVDAYWTRGMGGSVTRVAHDLFPGLVGNEDPAILFRCVWVMAADFYNHMAFETAAQILLYALGIAPQEHLAETLIALSLCAHAGVGADLEGQAVARLASSADEGRRQAVPLVRTLFEARRGCAYHSTLLLPSQVAARRLERPEARKLSFLQAEAAPSGL